MTQFKIFLIFSILPFLASAQYDWEGGLFLGYSNYLGDLTEPTFTLKEPNFAAGLLLRHSLNRKLNLRLNLFYGKLSGKDANFNENQERKAKFESFLLETSLLGEFEFFGHKRYDENGIFRKVTSPYIFAGLGFNILDPKVDYGNGNGVEEDFSNFHFALPLGAGIRTDINEKVNFGLEFGGRFTFSDYLDGISETGDPDDNDVYFFGGVVLGIRLGQTEPIVSENE